MNVVIYTSPTCVQCPPMKAQAETICKTRGVPLETVDIEAKRHLAPNWLTSVPTLVVKHRDGFEEVLAGQFANPAALRKSLRRDDE